MMPFSYLQCERLGCAGRRRRTGEDGVKDGDDMYDSSMEQIQCNQCDQNGVDKSKDESKSEDDKETETESEKDEVIPAEKGKVWYCKLKN
eukprot:13540252-Ditylum_brightwellii.AAC.2